MLGIPTTWVDPRASRQRVHPERVAYEDQARSLLKPDEIERVRRGRPYVVCQPTLVATPPDHWIGGGKTRCRSGPPTSPINTRRKDLSTRQRGIAGGISVPRWNQRLCDFWLSFLLQVGCSVFHIWCLLCLCTGSASAARRDRRRLVRSRALGTRKGSGNRSRVAASPVERQ